MNNPFPLSVKISSLLGYRPGVLFRTLREIPYFLSSLRRYQMLNTRPSFGATLKHLFPILTDRSASAGSTVGHYFIQDVWAARKIHKENPQRHIDIGSRLDGFIAHLLVFMPVTVVDIRPLTSDVPGLNFVRDDATQLSSFEDNSIGSLSTLHAAEHFGLGRYSDPVSPESCFQFMGALQRVLAPGGRLYFSVPVGTERVEFNAHRVFDPQTIIRSFPQLTMLSFSYIDDNEILHENEEPAAARHCHYGCGLFEFTKPV